MGGKQKKNWRTTNNWLNFSLIFFSCLTNKRASYRWAGIGFEGETGQDDGEIYIEGRPFDLSLIRNALNIRIGLAKAINGVENPKLPGNGAEEARLGAERERVSMELVTAMEFGRRRGGAVSELERMENGHGTDSDSSVILGGGNGRGSRD